MKYFSLIFCKKAVLDIPLVLLIQMVSGVLLLILVLLPIYNSFQVEDYNRSVTIDLAESFVDFVHFSQNNYNRGLYECIEPFKITYLSSPQIVNSRYNNYVLIVSSQGVGTITFEQFIEIWESNEGFRTIEIRDEISFDESINLNVLNLNTNTIDEQVIAMFLVPSIKISSLMRDTISGDYKAGYHLYFLKNEAGELVREPELHEGFFSRIYRVITRGDEPMNLYDFGYYRFTNTNSFGPILSSSDNLNLPSYCGSTSTAPGSGGIPQELNPSIVTRSNSCVAIFNRGLENEIQYRNSIYWNNGLQCSSSFENTRNFCNEFMSQEGIASSSYLEFDSIIETFNSFCRAFYESSTFQNIGTLSQINFETPDGDIQRIPRLNSELKFSDYFQRVNDDELINYVSSLGSRNMIRIFSRNDNINNCPNQFSQVLQGGGFFGSYENLCEKIIVYNRNGRSSLVFYIDNQDENLRGFYRLINEEYIPLYRNQHGNMEFRIGSLRVNQRNIQASDFSCNFLRFIGGYIGVSDGCNDLNIFQITIPQSVFDDISNPEFNIFLSDELRRANLLPQEVIDNYFLEVNDLNQAGENNEVIRINGRDYILNYRYLTPILQDAPTHPTRTHPSQRNMASYYFNFINLNQLVAFEVNRSPHNNMNELDFNFLSSRENLKFTPSLEQTLLSLYMRQDESFYQRVREDITNYNFRIFEHRFQDNFQIHINTFYTNYYVKTINTNVPVFFQIPSLESEVFLGAELLLPLLRDDEIEFEGNDINLLFPTINQGNIILETIPFNPSNEKVSQLRQEFNSLRNENR